jgi:hypothetical protein
MAGSIYRTSKSTGGASRNDTNGGHGYTPPTIGPNGAGNPPTPRPLTPPGQPSPTGGGTGPGGPAK